MNAPSLHPECLAWLEEAAKLSLPPSRGVPVTQVRERFRVLCRRFAGDPAPVQFAGEVEAPVPCRLYLPWEPHSQGVLVWFHGGRMISGDLETHDAACRLLAHTAGWRVLAVRYRLAPEHPFPAALQDAHAMLRWAESQYAFLAAGGDSAGASLALDAALHAGVRLRALALVYPMVDATLSLPSHQEFREGPGTSSLDIAMGYDLWLPSGTERRNPRVSPLFAESFSGLPRTFVSTAGFDPLRDEGQLLEARIREHGVAVTGYFATRHFHGYLSYPGHFAEARETCLKIHRFLGETA